MNMYFKSSKKGKKNTILDLLNFSDLFFDSDILSYDNDNFDEDYDYVIMDDNQLDDGFYKNDTIYYL